MKQEELENRLRELEERVSSLELYRGITLAIVGFIIGLTMSIIIF